ncbi:Rpn family recombination-promoting nuclease/putative transposase [Nostoc sp. UIC10630]|nr:Rpn family recombination-promoting nuclease/putative transposase [Nostoc sp. UIC 10630]
MRWDMSVLRESPWYQEILREGEARGEERGKTSGELRGILSAIEINLELKFSDRGLQLMPQINQIQDLERLKTILRNIVTANTVEELQQIL